jgi:hypothetical protein
MKSIHLDSAYFFKSIKRLLDFQQNLKIWSFEQKVGDLVVIPPGSIHQVVNQVKLSGFIFVNLHFSFFFFLRTKIR